MTPTALDYLADYDDALYPMAYYVQAGAGQSPSIYTPADADREPNPREGQNYGHRQQTWWSYATSVLAYDMDRPAGTAYYHKPRGSWRVKKYALNGGVARVPLVTDADIYVTFEVTEPLLISPFIGGSGYGKQGFYWIQSTHFQMNMNGNANRAWRSARQITY
ncbi:MAG: phage major capsid domain-containing protein, partial [Candidatus Fonsibacter sp.]